MKKRTARPEKPMALGRPFLTALPHRDSMVLPVTKSSVKQRRAIVEDLDARCFSELQFDELAPEGGFRLDLVSTTSSKLFVNSLGDADGVIRAIELDHVPSGRALMTLGAFSQSISTAAKLALVATGGRLL